MPSFPVTAPDGTRYIVNAPEGATEEDVLQYAKSQLAPPEPEPKPEVPVVDPIDSILDQWAQQGQIHRGFGGNLAAALSRAGTGFGTTFADQIPAAFYTAIGNDEAAKKQLAEAKAKQEEAARLNPPQFKGVEEVTPSTFLPFLGEKMGEAIPATGTTLGLGVAAALAGAPAAAGAAIAYLGSFALNAPNELQNLYDKTGKLELPAAAISGGLQSALDILPEIRLAGKIAGPLKAAVVEKLLAKSGMEPSLLKTVAKETGLATVGEGLTGGAQEAISIAAEKIVGENNDLWGSEEFSRILNGAVSEAAGGLAFGPVGGVLEHGRIKNEKFKIDEANRIKEEEESKINAENQRKQELSEYLPDLEDHINLLSEQIGLPENRGRAGELNYNLRQAQQELDSLYREYNYLNLSPEEREQAETEGAEEEEAESEEPTATVEQNTVQSVLEPLGITAKELGLKPSAPLRGAVAKKVADYVDEWRVSPDRSFEEAQAADALLDEHPELQTNAILKARQEERDAHLASVEDLTPKKVDRWYQSALEDHGLAPNEINYLDSNKRSWEDLSAARYAIKNAAARAAISEKLKRDFPQYEQAEIDRVSKLTEQQKLDEERARAEAILKKAQETSYRKEVKETVNNFLRIARERQTALAKRLKAEAEAGRLKAEQDTRAGQLISELDRHLNSDLPSLIQAQLDNPSSVETAYALREMQTTISKKQEELNNLSPQGVRPIPRPTVVAPPNIAAMQTVGDVLRHAGFPGAAPRIGVDLKAPLRGDAAERVQRFLEGIKPENVKTREQAQRIDALRDHPALTPENIQNTKAEDYEAHIESVADIKNSPQAFKAWRTKLLGGRKLGETPEVDAAVYEDLRRAQAKAETPVQNRIESFIFSTKPLKDIHDAQQAPSGPLAEVRESRAKNNTPYTQDLFGNPLPPTAPGRAGAGVGAGGRGRTARFSTVDNVPGTYARKTKVVVETTRDIGIDKIDPNDPSAAAVAFASLAKNTRERLQVLITDKNGKPLAIVGTTHGNIDSASVYPSVIASEAFRIKNAAFMWVGHNHPSGDASLSASDLNLNKKIGELFENSGIELKGVFAIAGGETINNRNWEFAKPGSPNVNLSGTTGNVTSKLKVPVVERVFSDFKTLGPAITGPTSAISSASTYSNGNTGLLLLDTRHNPVGFLPFDLSTVHTLRRKGGLDVIMRALSLSNANNVIAVDNNRTMSLMGANNLATMLKQYDLRLLDVVDIDANANYSWVARGQDPDPNLPKFFSRAAKGSSAKPTPEQVRKVIEDRMGARAANVIIARTPEEAGVGNVKGIHPLTKGAIINGKAYLFTDNMRVGKEFGVFLHEVGDHLGMKKLVGEGNYNLLVSKIKEWADKNNGSLESKIARAAMERIPEGTPVNDELLAYFIEEAVDNYGVNPSEIKDTATPLGAFFRKIVAGIKNILNKLGLSPKDLTSQDIIDLAYGAAHLELAGTVQISPAERRAIAAEVSPNFNKWLSTASNGDVPNTPITQIFKIDEAGDYRGGPAVFQGLHGTTHNNILWFDPTIGSKLGFLGQGPYVTTSTDDANANYAGFGPDLKANVLNETYDLLDLMNQDTYVQDEILGQYFDNNPTVWNTVAISQLGIDPNSTYEDLHNQDKEDLLDQYGEVAAKEAATKKVAGKSLGLNMPVWVKFHNPFDMRRSSNAVIEIEYDTDENGDIIDGSERGNGVKLVNALREAADYYQVDVTDAVVDIFDGIKPFELYKTLKDNEYIDVDTGEYVSTGQFLQEVLKDAGYDGIIMNAYDFFPHMIGVENDTLHLKPLYSNQIKSEFNQGTYGLNTPEILKSLSSNKNISPLGFYSALEYNLSRLPTKSATAAGWKDAVKGLVNKGQVKAEEVEWSGINDWLDLTEGKITREQVQEYLAQGGVQVEETVLGRVKKKNDKPLTWGEWSEPDENGHKEMKASSGSKIIYKPKHSNSGPGTPLRDDYVLIDSNGRHQGTVNDLEHAKQITSAFESNAIKNPTKYNMYTIPGGENYREVLLKLPEIEPQKTWEWFDPESQTSERGFDTQQAAYDARPNSSAVVSQVEVSNRNLNYRHGHWPSHSNILAHIRLNDRVDADGKRVLFIEEVQSDWGQEGKKKGFDKGPEINMDLARELGIEREASGIPSAPFVTKTEGWVNLALKRIMIMAAEEGYDRVAFVNGKQSADRYNLVNYVDSIHYEPSDKGFYVNIMKDGANIKKGDFTKSELEAMIGHEIVQKMEKGEGKPPFEPEIEPDLANVRVLSDEGLTVGGQGMKTFYDQIIPSALKKLLPKVDGGKPRTVTMERGLPSTIAGSQNSDYKDFSRWIKKKHPLEDFSSEDISQIWRHGYNNNLFVQEWFNDNRVMDQLGFDITPEMVSKIEGGLPQFSRAPEIQFTIDELIKAAKSQKSWRDWYTRYEPVVNSLFGSDAPLFKKLLSATSQASSVATNVALAIKAYRQLLAGEPFTGYMEAVVKNLDRVRNEENLRGQKIAEFAKANAGDEEGIAVDRHIARLFFDTDRPTAKQVAVAKERIIQIAKRLKWKPSEVQAALWAFNQVRTGKDPSKVVGYDTVLLKKLQQINAIRTQYGRRESAGVSASGTVAQGNYGTKTDTSGTGEDGEVSVRESRAPSPAIITAVNYGTPQARKTVGDYVLGGMDTVMRNTPRWGREKVGSILGAISNMPTSARGFMYYSVPLPHFADMVEKVNPAAAKNVRKLADIVAERKTRSDQRKEYIQKILTDGKEVFDNYSETQLAKFEEIAHNLSREEIDPWDAANKTHPLVKQFNATPKPLQDIFNQVVAAYRQFGDEYIDHMEKIAGPAFSPAMKMQYKMRMKRIMPYLPLFREGDFWVAYTDKNGESVVRACETELERHQAIRAAQAAGATDIQPFKQLGDINPNNVKPTREFAQIFNLMKAKKVDEAVQAKVYQTLLQMFPAKSIMQQFRPRKGTAGYREDILRNFAIVGSRMADNLTQFEFTKDIDNVYSALDKDFLKSERSGDDRSIEMLNELKQREQFLRYPVNNKYANLAASASYNQYLLGNISSAIMNNTSLVMSTLPNLAGEYGPIKTQRAMTKALGMYAKGGRDHNTSLKIFGRRLSDKTFMGDSAKGKALAKSRPDLKKLYDTAVSRQAIHRSVGLELHDMKESALSEYTGSWIKIKTLLGYLFQNSERMNREISLIAAYQLEKDKLAAEGITGDVAVDRAIDKAINLVSFTQGVGAPELGSRMFQSNMGKVIGTFKKYPMTQLYMVGTLFNESIKGASPKERSIARKQLMGVLGIGWAFAGVKGLPLVGAISFIAELLMGDKDDPFDVDKWALESMGNMGWNGLVSDMTGLRISDRAAIGSFFREDKKRLQELGWQWYSAEQLIGPAASITKNWLDALELFNQGYTEKALERALPLGAANLLKAVNQGVNGIRTKDGVKIADDPSMAELISQGVGFRSERVARMQDVNNIENQITTAVNARRVKILSDLWRFRDDPAKLIEIELEKEKFNESKYVQNHKLKITEETIRRSMKQRDIKQKEAEEHFGMSPDKRFSEVFQELEETIGE